MPSKIRAVIQIKNTVQDVGFRSIVTAILIENGIVRAKVINNIKNKKAVDVILEETEETLNDIKEILKTEIEKSEDEIPNLPKHFTVSEPQKVNANPHELPKLSPYGSDALQLRQMSKFVGVGGRMATDMESMDKNMNGMRKDMSGMRKNMSGMRSDFKKLSKNIIKAIKMK